MEHLTWPSHQTTNAFPPPGARDAKCHWYPRYICVKSIKSRQFACCAVFLSELQGNVGFLIMHLIVSSDHQHLSSTCCRPGKSRSDFFRLGNVIWNGSTQSQIWGFLYIVHLIVSSDLPHFTSTWCRVTQCSLKHSAGIIATIIQAKLLSEIKVFMFRYRHNCDNNP